MDVTKLQKLLYQSGAQLTYEGEEVVEYEYGYIGGRQFSRPSEYKQKYSINMNQDDLQAFCDLLNKNN